MPHTNHPAELNVRTLNARRRLTSAQPKEANDMLLALAIGLGTIFALGTGFVMWTALAVSKQADERAIAQHKKEGNL